MSAAIRWLIVVILALLVFVLFPYALLGIRLFFGWVNSASNALLALGGGAVGALGILLFEWIGRVLKRRSGD